MREPTKPLLHIDDAVQAVRRDRQLVRRPDKRRRIDYLPSLYAFFQSQLPLVAVRGQGNDFLPFALALRHWVKPAVGSTPAQVNAFWTAKRREMETQWGDRSAHKELGIEPLESEFLCWLAWRKRSLAAKQSFLQDFRDNDWRLGSQTISVHPVDRGPVFSAVVEDDIEPAASLLMIERSYRLWAKQRKLPKSVITPLTRLVSELVNEAFDAARAISYYGSTFDSSMTRREQIVETAVAVMAADGSFGAAFEHDHALAHDARIAISNNPAIQKVLPP